MDAARDVLITGSGSRGAARERVRAAVGHALSFSTWQSLVREEGLDDAAAVELMAELAKAAGERRMATSR